jgi:hypothetical protein
VEKKPHPKKVAIIFSAMNFGDGTGFAGSDGTPIPEKPARVKEKQNGWPTSAPQAGLSRPPDSPFRQATFLLPAGTSPADLFPEGGGNFPASLAPAQSCCTDTCLRTEVGGE